MPLPTSDHRVRIKATAFVVYRHAQVDKVVNFLADFGMTLVEDRGNEKFYAGYGDEPFCYWLRNAPAGEPAGFGGAAYEVEERRELEKAAKIPGAASIQQLDTPGGGEIVTVKDPFGFYVHFVYGQKRQISEAKPRFKDHTVNYEYEGQKPRKGQFLRLEPGPAPVHKFGHYGFTYPEGQHDQVYEFYTKYLALAPSDQLSRDGKVIVTFFHIDRAKDFTGESLVNVTWPFVQKIIHQPFLDHHCFFIKPAKPGLQTAVAHSAFEVHDYDTQQLGHQHLINCGHKICWGVGRHILGSQIFDYWFDPSNFVIEHYCDGDLVNEDTQVSQGKAGPESLKVWGPPVPSVF